MYGNSLPPSEKGHVGSGLGLNPPTGGTVTLIPPTEIVVKNDGTRARRPDANPREIPEKTPETIDGLTFYFYLTPNTEAPAEMHWYTEELAALCAAENCTKTLHNTYTLRGAKTRDALAWSKALDETLRLWGDKATIMYAPHHWPVFTNAEVKASLAAGRDGYRFLHDQTLRLANSGLNKEEIADRIAFPPELANIWELRGYYGSVSHNVRGIYTFYFGWFVGNPVNLNPHTPAERAKRYLERMGGPEQLLAKAEAAYRQGDYRWVIEALEHVIVAAARDESPAIQAALRERRARFRLRRGENGPAETDLTRAIAFLERAGPDGLHAGESAAGVPDALFMDGSAGVSGGWEDAADILARGDLDFYTPAGRQAARSRLHALRGWTRLALERPDEAGVDFAEVGADVGSDDAETAFGVWLAARARGRVDNDEALRRRGDAAASDTDRALASFYLGEIGDAGGAEVLRVAQNADERCRVHFLLGVYALLHGDPARALVDFDAARVSGSPSSWEYATAAGFRKRAEDALEASRALERRREIREFSE